MTSLQDVLYESVMKVSPVSLQQRCLNQVLPRDRERGATYFNRRRVSLGAREADGIAATVEGSAGAVYEVKLDWSTAEATGRLAVHCDCPRFADFYYCKHLWATIVAYDAAQFTEPVPGRGRLVLERAAQTTGSVQRPAAPGDALRPASDLDSPETDFDPFHEPLPRFMTEEEEARLPGWRRQLVSIRAALAEDRRLERPWPRSEPWEVFYRINVARCFDLNELVVDLHQRRPGRDGRPAAMTRLNLIQESLDRFPDAADRDFLRLFKTSPTADYDPYAARFRSSYQQTRGTVPPVLYDTLLPRLCATGRFGWVDDHASDPAKATPLSWDGEEPWRFALVLESAGGDDSMVRVRGALRRGDETRSLSEPLLLLANGAVLWADRISRLRADDVFPWISELRREGEITLPATDLDLLLEDLSALPELPELDMPPEWRWDEVRPAPRPRLSLRSAAHFRSTALEGTVSFDYDGFLVASGGHATSVFDRGRRRIVHRDREAEQAALRQLRELGIGSLLGTYDVRLSESVLLEAIEPLLDSGWWVEAEERRVLRPADDIQLDLASRMGSAGRGQSIDWFELRGEVRFEGTTIELPRLLQSVRSGERMIRLDDGSQGMLPRVWLERFGPLARLAQGDSDGAMRYLPSQAALLDALLEAEPHADVDRAFETLRERLSSFERIEPSPEPRGFHGELRAYQRDGLGWLKFLESLGLCGCLADDMGLGKTVQVLALLQARRLRRPSDGVRRPSLIVAPLSVVHNWVEEAARFTPRMTVVSYSGPRRKKLLPEVEEGRWNLVVTTYGLLRRDVTELREIELDYVVLDEAQAIKNASSQGAKASRLLRARHRLALTGTPVENHLGELWSIFEFLNPGMLGRLPAFKGLTGAKKSPVKADALDTAALGSVSAALKPFILRRTKDQVLDDLPEKTEQTLYCDLDRRQWRLYRELRDHYRAALDRRIETDGLARSKIHVLEALLRLRQAACHPGLVDPERGHLPSAKLDTLLEQLDEVLQEGHKALVFSQFVSLLEIVKQRLDQRQTPYEYLDGQTRDRKRRIDRFQNEPDCQLFLISLKAGGLGLNLTAASYVFILDPWWNPAVEAQAVDRAHRIGQTRPVFAYRLIARRTVEEKIVELQASKRELADAILSASGGVIRNLTADDLRLLLS